MTTATAAIGAGMETSPGNAVGRLATLRRTIDQVVGSVFYGTLLKTMHSSVLQGEFGHGGRGEEVFQAQLDQILAERSGRAGSLELNEVLFERLSRGLQSARIDPGESRASSGAKVCGPEGRGSQPDGAGID